MKMSWYFNKHEDFIQQAFSRLDRHDRVQFMERGSQQESGEIRYLKEANKKLLQQNHKLLGEMERYSDELNAARSKVCQQGTWWITNLNQKYPTDYYRFFSQLWKENYFVEQLLVINLT